MPPPTTDTEPTPEIAAPPKWIDEHRKDYIASGGTKGHIFNFGKYGGHKLTPTLLLRTTGRKSARTRILPLIYGVWQGEAVIIGSKGGAPSDPAWYLNMKDGSDVAFQIGPQAWKARWREPKGAERAAVWKYMEELFPPYTDYQKATAREIPVIMMTPLDEIELFHE